MAFKTVNSGLIPATPVAQSETVSPSAPTTESFGELVEIVKEAHTTGVTMDQAEKYAARFLGAQLTIAAELAGLDIDARMKKNGMKAAKAQAYLDICRASDKKPSDVYIEQEVTLNSTVCTTVDMFDRADARKENLTLYLGIFKDAHVYFRGIAKGTYNG